MSRIISRKTLPSPARQRLYRAVALACALVAAWLVFDASRPVPRSQTVSAPRETPAPAGLGAARAPVLVPPPAAPSPAPTTAPVVATAAPVARAPVDILQLTASRPLAARAFLNEVDLLPRAHGGFVVEGLLAEGRYERMGLRRGDVLYTLDTPTMAQVDESSMIALTQQTEIELDIYRDGVPMSLRIALNVDPADDREPHEPR